MENYLIIIGVAIVISLLYSMLYYHRLNDVISKKRSRLYKLTPGLFFAILSLISLAGILSSTIQKVYALEDQIERLEDKEVENKYVSEGFPNLYFEYVFTYYNQFFGGGYSENGNMILCVRQDSPQDLIEYLQGNNVAYVYVQNSYSDLLQLQQLIYDSITGIPGLLIIGNNEKENKVTILTGSVDLVSERFQSYIDSGILEVDYIDDISY